MTILELMDGLETYGADLGRWPRDLAEAAIDLLAVSPEAQDAFARATAEDLLIFDGEEPPGPQAADGETPCVRPHKA